MLFRPKDAFVDELFPFLKHTLPMNFPVDIHTHQPPQVPGEAIVNCYPETFSPQEGGWYSVGIHPWYIGTPAVDVSSVLIQQEHSVIQSEAKNLLSYQQRCLEAILHHPQVLAVGEAGLDKLADAPMDLQLEVFEYQARLADEVGKPLVIHLVRAADELLKLKRELRPAMPWIIHGFRGKAALAEEYLRHGFYLSFGEKYQTEALLATPVDRLLIETDESVVPIEELYQRAAAVRGMCSEELHKIVSANIGKVFFKR